MMRFILTGFSPDMGFRIFRFEGIAEDRTRAEYTVKIDLAIARRYGIPVQDLPQLCHRLLERRATEDDQQHTLNFTEDEMCLHAKGRAETLAAAQRKRAIRRGPITPRPQMGEAPAVSAEKFAASGQ